MRANNETILQVAEIIGMVFKDISTASFVAGELDRRGLLRPTDPVEAEGWRGWVAGFNIEVDEHDHRSLVRVDLKMDGERAYMGLPPILARHLGEELIKASEKAKENHPWT